jgi:hypothetical protein
MAESCRRETSDHGLLSDALLTFDNAASIAPSGSFCDVGLDG